MTARWTPEQYLDYLHQRVDQKPSAASAVEALGLPTTTPKKARKKAAATALHADVIAPVKPKRRGVDVAPILASINNCHPRIQLTHAPLPVLAIQFDGARLLTVNEIISILQYRKYEIFRYKKAWRRLMSRALLLLPPGPIPRFEGPVRLELVRRGSRTLDDDASRTPFKYAIDSLIRCKLLKDDDRSVVVDTVAMDVVGPVALGIRIVALASAPPPEQNDPMSDWFFNSPV